MAILTERPSAPIAGLSMYQTLLDSPVGPLRATASSTALCALEFFEAGRMQRGDARLARWFDMSDTRPATNGVITTVEAWLDAYFAGDNETVRPSLDMRGSS